MADNGLINSPFNKLPGELRNMIYDYAIPLCVVHLPYAKAAPTVEEHNGPIDNLSDYDCEPQYRFNHQHALAHTCRQIWQETQQLVFQRRIPKYNLEHMSLAFDSQGLGEERSPRLTGKGPVSPKEMYRLFQHTETVVLCRRVRRVLFLPSVYIPVLQRCTRDFEHVHTVVLEMEMDHLAGDHIRNLIRLVAVGLPNLKEIRLLISFWRYYPRPHSFRELVAMESQEEKQSTQEVAVEARDLPGKLVQVRKGPIVGPRVQDSSDSSYREGSGETYEYRWDVTYPVKTRDYGSVEKAFKSDYRLVKASTAASCKKDRLVQALQSLHLSEAH